MNLLLPIEAFDAFKEVREHPDTTITSELIDAVKRLDERDEFEPFLRCILADAGQTPHGPAEIVDIFTHKLSVKGQFGIAGFILKGKSFSTIRPSDVAHQIYRLKKIGGLKYAVFAAGGTILDAAKDQFCTTCEEIGCHYAIFGAVELARLFVAHGFLCPRDARVISAGRCRCGYSPQKRILNLLQKEALDGLAIAHKANHKTALVVLPPGSGKTRIAAEDARRSNAQCVLYVAHTNEILDVAESEFSAKFGTKDVARLDSAASLAHLGHVNIATIQLIAGNLEKLSSDQFDYIVVDEFHHAAAKSYRLLKAHAVPNFMLGLTATPFRSDEQDIRQLCNEVIVVHYELRFGIETGVLCPYHYFGCFDDVDYTNISHNGSYYNIRDLERELVIPKRDKAIIKKWREKAEGKATVAFCCSIEHAKRVAAHFRKEGFSAAVYTSEVRWDKRHEILTEFKSGQIKVLCVVDVLNEGADLPLIECLLFLRPTESKRIFYQQLGRGLRRYPGKSHCVVIDFIGNFKNAHKIIEYQGLLPFPDDDRFDYIAGPRRPKELLNLPLGCEVNFDDKVIDIFASRANSPEFATRFNIERILLYQFDRLAKRLGRHPTKREIDKNYLVNSEIYATLWGSWDDFESAVVSREIPQ